MFRKTLFQKENFVLTHHKLFLLSSDILQKVCHDTWHFYRYQTEYYWTKTLDFTCILVTFEPRFLNGKRSDTKRPISYSVTMLDLHQTLVSLRYFQYFLFKKAYIFIAFCSTVQCIQRKWKKKYYFIAYTLNANKHLFHSHKIFYYMILTKDNFLQSLVWFYCGKAAFVFTFQLTYVQD